MSDLVAVRVDQLGRFPGCGRPGFPERVDELLRVGVFRSRIVHRGEPGWLWVSRSGASRWGVRAGHLDLRLLDHRYYVNEVRLHLADAMPDWSWRSEGTFRGPVEGRRSVEYPDGVLESGGARVAVEVELSAKPREVLRPAIAAKLRTYQRVVYFCREGVIGLISSVVDEPGLERVVIRGMPCGPPRPVASRPAPAARGPVRERERELAVWVSEQGGGRLDHLARHLGVPEAEADALASGCEEAGSLGRAPGLEDEADWFWARGRGVRLAGNGLAPWRGLSVWRYAHFSVMNGLRLRFEERGSDSVWVSHRVLAAARRRGGSRGAPPRVPDAVLEDPDGRRTAICVIWRCTSKGTAPVAVAGYAREFDRVVCVGRPRALSVLASTLGRSGIRNVGYFDLDGQAIEPREHRPRRRFRRGGVSHPLQEVGGDVSAVVRLCAEEGYLAVAEVAALVEASPREAAALLSGGIALGLLRDDWVDALGRTLYAPTTAGVRLSGCGVMPPDGRGGKVGVRQAVVQARVELTVGVEDAVWVPGRVLASAGGVAGHRLKGLVERSDRRCGVEVAMTVPTGPRWQRLVGLVEACDEMVVYCSTSAFGGVGRLVETQGRDRVELRPVAREIEADWAAVHGGQRPGSGARGATW